MFPTPPLPISAPATSFIQTTPSAPNVFPVQSLVYPFVCVRHHRHYVPPVLLLPPTRTPSSSARNRCSRYQLWRQLDTIPRLRDKGLGSIYPFLPGIDISCTRNTHERGIAYHNTGELQTSGERNIYYNALHVVLSAHLTRSTGTIGLTNTQDRHHWRCRWHRSWRRRN